MLAVVSPAELAVRRHSNSTGLSSDTLEMSERGLYRLSRREVVKGVHDPGGEHHPGDILTITRKYCPADIVVAVETATWLRGIADATGRSSLQSTG